MTFGPKTLWYLNITMVIISSVLLVYDPNDINPTLGRFVFKGLLIAYMVLGFMANGVMPPKPPTTLPKG
jgi:hypothetical protein